PWLLCLICGRPVLDYPPARSDHRTRHRADARRRGQDAIRAQVFDRDAYRCQLRDVAGAGRCYGPLTPHHRRKASQGGGYTLANLVTLCRHHNDQLEARADVAALGEQLGLVVRRR
ncbi:MAG TPA: HNH endonuclease signature motif containing protein, partial [Acidimicrobiales bacterium]|nr:HNH endonuclease signature motif containing protein [Acidimicrobiales bacterium]